MSGTNPDDGLSGLGAGADPQSLAALVPEDKVDPDKGIAAKPTAAPKLSMSKGTKKVQAPAAPTAAGADQAQKKQQILDSLQENAAPRRATAPVHAAPVKPAVASATANPATVQAPTNGAAQAKATAVTKRNGSHLMRFS